jgi:hypothetical protein
MKSSTLLRVTACAAAGLLVCACQTNKTTKYRKGNKVNDWGTYEGGHFDPVNVTLNAVDPDAGTITVDHGGRKATYAVNDQTRIFHDTAVIELHDLPLNHTVKIRVAEDGHTLYSIWYGAELKGESHGPAQTAHRTTFY